ITIQQILLKQSRDAIENQARESALGSNVADGPAYRPERQKSQREHENERSERGQRISQILRAESESRRSFAPECVRGEHEYEDDDPGEGIGETQSPDVEQEHGENAQRCGSRIPLASTR